MRITFKCLSVSKRTGAIKDIKTGQSKDIILYSAEFGVYKGDKQASPGNLLSGSIKIESTEEISLNPEIDKKYTVDMNGLSGLIVPHSVINQTGKDS
jgi:hypothetical protein